jgi:dTDP-glucose pyrophosphorylase
MTGFQTVPLISFHARHLVWPSNRGKHEIREAIDLLTQSGRMINAIGLGDWRIDVSCV